MIEMIVIKVKAVNEVAIKKIVVKKATIKSLTNPVKKVVREAKREEAMTLN